MVFTEGLKEGRNHDAPDLRGGITCVCSGPRDTRAQERLVFHGSGCQRMSVGWFGSHGLGRRVFPKGRFRFSAKPAVSAIIQTGPYRFIRHPIYAGALLILWGSIAGHLSITNFGIGFVVSLVILGKIVVEERLLRASFPDYEQYARSTKAVIPFVL